MRDWNNDGQIDSRDGFVDYMIYKEIIKGNANSEKGKNNSSNSIRNDICAFGVGLLIFGIIVVLGWVL